MKHPRQSGMSLIEIMVSVTLLSLIVIGLLAVFNNTTRALRIAHNMTDVFEGARATDDLVVRDILPLTAAGDTNTYNIYAVDLAPFVFTMPDGAQHTNVVQDLFMLSRENDTWFATGYFIDQKTAGLGTLYRFSTNGPWYGSNFTFTYLMNWWQSFTNGTVKEAHRVTDGIIHFKAHAYDEKGRVYEPSWTSRIPTDGSVNTNLLLDNIQVGPGGFAFSGNFTPAYVEVEIGILEPETTRRYNAIAANNLSGAQSYLLENLGKVHLFRQRIPVRNHTSPPAFD
jgi:type II secretory pathway pseudopilin PulG